MHFRALISAALLLATEVAAHGAVTSYIIAGTTYPGSVFLLCLYGSSSGSTQRAVTWDSLHHLLRTSFNGSGPTTTLRFPPPTRSSDATAEGRPRCPPQLGQATALPPFGSNGLIPKVQSWSGCTDAQVLSAVATALVLGGSRSTRVVSTAMASESSWTLRTRLGGILQDLLVQTGNGTARFLPDLPLAIISSDTS